MSRLVIKAVQAAAGNAGGDEAVYVDDVFSTYLYAGNGSTQNIMNGIDLGAYPFIKVASTDGNSVSGSETFTVTVKANTKLVVFILDSDNALPTCTVDGSSLTAATSSSNSGGGFYDSAVFIETLTAGSHTIVTSDTALGHTEVMLFDPNATVSVHTNLGVTTQSATSVTTSAVTTDGFCVFLGSDRDPSANFSCNQTSTEYYEETHTYFNFGAIGINGSSGTVPASVISGMVGTYATNWCLLKVEGIGNDPTANSAASGEGGMVWIKNRSSATDHYLFDTERGATKRLITNKTSAEATSATSLTSFNSNGFSLGSLSQVNSSGGALASWTFRKQPGFFDVVTYTGNSTAGHTISHNLGTVPGMIIIKWVNTAGDWSVYHRSTGNQTIMRLNSTAGTSSYGNSVVYFNNTDPTSTEFTLGSATDMNFNGYDYVAYLFAHDAQDFGTNSDEAIIKCGSYGPGTETLDGPEVNLGFEPQWVLTKCYDNTGDWVLHDNMRGVATNGNDKWLRPNTSGTELTGENIIFTSTGFKITSYSAYVNQSGYNYIYVAIRRPHKPASKFAATDLFSIDGAGSATNPAFQSNNHIVDMGIQKRPAATDASLFFSRLTGNKYLNSTSTAAEATGSSISWDYMDGMLDSFSATSYQGWMFRRAPGFFDVVTYTGSSSAQEIPHNLGVAPELIIQKCRTQGTYPWNSWYTGLTNSQYINFNDSPGVQTSSNLWGTNATVATDSVFRTGSGNTGVDGSTSDTHVAYLFATAPGISKVGTFNRPSQVAQDIDCGFENGARFVLIKRTNTTGNWVLWDSVRGIVAGNEPYFLTNTSAAQVTNQDYIDPLSSGFTLTSGIATGDWVFLAIA